MRDPRRSIGRYRWLLAAASVAVALLIGEGLLRYALFHTTVELGAKEPQYYARSLDELWIYRHLFSTSERWIVAPGDTRESTAADAAGENGGSRIEFYRRWPASLMPDPTLGYVRKPDVRIPCHETTQLATRGTHEYTEGGAKIAFFGDSFVESAACSNDTLTAKIERLSGIDTLNYGIGGYGLDQVYLYWKRLLPSLKEHECSNCLFLAGLINDDLSRVLLKIRTSPKPYLTVGNGALALHTDHIHPASLSDAYRRPPERSYLYYFLRGRLGFPIYRAFLTDTRDRREHAIGEISDLIFKDMAELSRQYDAALAFVIFPTPGAVFDPRVVAQMRAHKLPVVDLQTCLRASGRADTELYAELHPTSLGNELLARCLLRDLVGLHLLH